MGGRNVFMTKSSRKNVPDVGIELGAACMPSEHASDRTTAPGDWTGMAVSNGKTASSLCYNGPLIIHLYRYGLCCISLFRAIIMP